MPVRRQVRRPPHARRIGAGRRNSRQLFSLIIRWLGSAFTSTDSVECVDDQAAIQKAQQVVNGHDVELWERDRSIVRFSHDDQQIGQS